MDDYLRAFICYESMQFWSCPKRIPTLASQVTLKANGSTRIVHQSQGAEYIKEVDDLLHECGFKVSEIRGTILLGCTCEILD
jgi:hypothetical protein